MKEGGGSDIKERNDKHFYIKMEGKSRGAGMTLKKFKGVNTVDIMGVGSGGNY